MSLRRVDYQAALDEAAFAEKVAIVGGPGAGKTTFLGRLMLARQYPVVSNTDYYNDLPWDDQPAALAAGLAPYDQWAVEGVGASRAMKKGLLEPDLVVWLVGRFRQLSPKAAALGRRVDDDVLAYCRKHGNVIKVVGQ